MKRRVLGVVLSCCMILNSGMAVFAEAPVATVEETAEIETKESEETTDVETEVSEESDELMADDLESVDYNANLTFDNMREADGENTYIFLNEKYTTKVNVSEDITSQYENLFYEWAVYYRNGNAEEQDAPYCYDTDVDDPARIIIDGSGLNHCVDREDRSFRAEVTIKNENDEVVARGGFVIHVAGTVSELGKSEDIQLLRGWEYKVPNTLYKYVKNTDYPYGREFILAVTGVTVKNRYNDGDPACAVETAADGWIIRANNVQDTATATVFFNDENGQSDSYEFFVCVAGDIVELEYTYPRGTDQMPQSSTMDISTAAKHTWNHGQYGAGDEYLENYTVDIEDETFNQSYDHELMTVSVKEDGKTICVQSKGLSGESDIKIRLTAQYGNGGTWSQVFPIHVKVAEEFNYICMEEIAADMPLGTSVTINPRVMDCRSSGDEDVTYSWLEMDRHKGILSFDPNAFCITDANGQTVSSGEMRALGTSYTVKRIGEGASALSYKVMWYNSDICEYEFYCEKNVQIKAVSYDLTFDSKYGVDSQNDDTFIFENESTDLIVESNIFDNYASGDVTWDITLIDNDTQAQITEGYSDLVDGKITLDGDVLKAQADAVKLTLKATAGDITVVERSLLVNILENRMDLPDNMIDRQILCGDRVHVSKNFTAYTRSPLFPAGEEVDYVVTEVAASDRNCKVVSTEDGWDIYSDVAGAYDVTVTYITKDENAYSAAHTFTLSVQDSLLLVEFGYMYDNNSMLPNDTMDAEIYVSYRYKNAYGSFETSLDEDEYTIEAAMDEDGNPLYDTSILEVSFEKARILTITSYDGEGIYRIPLVVTHQTDDGVISKVVEAMVNITDEYYNLLIDTYEMNNLKVGQDGCIGLTLLQNVVTEEGNMVTSLIDDPMTDVRFRLEYDETKVQVSYQNGSLLEGVVIKCGDTTEEGTEALSVSRLSTDRSRITLIAEIRGYWDDDYHEVSRKSFDLKPLEYRAAFDNMTDGNNYTRISLKEEHPVSISASDVFAEYAGNDLDVSWSIYACNDGESTELSEGYSVSEDGKVITLDGAAFMETSAPHNKGFRAEVQIKLDHAVLLTDSFGFDLNYYDISEGVITLNTTSYTYTGSVIKPNITVTYNGTTLVEGEDYTLTLPTSSDAGTKTFYAVGMGCYVGKLKGTYTIKQVQSVVKVPYTSITKTYGDAAFTPNVTKTGTGTLKYSSSNTAVATVSSAGKITIKGVGKAVIRVYAAGTTNYKKSSTKTMTVTVNPKAPASAPVLTNTNTPGVKVVWKAVSGATGYVVYRKLSTASNYSKVKTVTSGTATTWTDTSAVLGKTYTYVIQSYKKADGVTYYSKSTSAKTIRALGVAAITSTVKSGTSVKITWKKCTGASGYEIMRKLSTQTSYKKVKTITSGSKVSWTDTNIGKGKKYNYKVRAYYKTSSGTYYYGAY